MMNKKSFVKSLAQQLRWSQKDVEYYTAYILDYLIFEAGRHGHVKFDSHNFKKVDKISPRLINKTTGQKYSIPEIVYKHRNLKSKRKPSPTPKS